jgi:hypothetical protein
MTTAPGDRDLCAGIVRGVLHTRRSVRAAILFVEWLKSNGGRATQKEMSRFADELKLGSRGVKFGRPAFYRDILDAFKDRGLVELSPSYDARSRKVVKEYRRIVQPIAKRRPSGPSLMYNAHILAEKWNSYFGE